MSETIQTKQCSKCKKFKPFSEFSKNRSHKDGYSNNCKICEYNRDKKYKQTKEGKAARKRYKQSKKGKVANKRYGQTDKSKVAGKSYRQSEKGKATRQVVQKRFLSRNPNHLKAKMAVNHAVAAGKLPKVNTLKCACGEQAEQYHHHKGYAPEHWLDVIPVCKKCHFNAPCKGISSAIISSAS